MNDMTTFLGLDTKDFAQGLARARTLANAEGGKLQQVLNKQKGNFEKTLIGGNLARAAIAAPAIAFTVLAKAYSDYAEKYEFARRGADQLKKQASESWEQTGRIAVLWFENVKGVGTSAFKSLSESLHSFMDDWHEGGLSDLMDAQKNEKATKALAEGAAMRRGLERDILSATGDEKGLKLLDARIEREKMLAEIEEKRTKGLINARDAEHLRSLVQQRFFFTAGEENDPETLRRQAWRDQGMYKAADEEYRREQDKERAKKRKEREEEHRRDATEQQVVRQRDRIDAMRMQKQEARATAMQAELDLWERLDALHDKVLTKDERELAVQHAKLDSAIRLESKLREMNEVGGVRERSIGSGLYSAALADQVFRRPGSGPQDTVLKAAQENLRQQTVATSKLTRIEEATAGLLAVAQERLGMATFAR